MNLLMKNGYFRRECMRETFDPLTALNHDILWYFDEIHHVDFTGIEYGTRIYYVACMKEYMDIVKKLRVPWTDYHLFQSCVWNRKYKVVLYFLQKYEEYLLLRHTDFKGNITLIISHWHDKCFDVIKYLLSHPVYSRYMVQFSDYIIRELTYVGLIEIIQYLEKNGVICTSLEDMLENSVKSGNLQLTKYVIEDKGAAVNGTDALLISIKRKDFVIFKYLVSQGAYIHDNYEEPLRTALMINGSTEIVYYLLDCYVDFSGVRENIQTEILVHAFSMLDMEIIHKLVEKGIVIKKDVLSACFQSTEYILPNKSSIFHKNVFSYLLDHCTEKVIKEVLHMIYNNNNTHYAMLIEHYITQGGNIHLHHDIFLQSCIKCNNIKHIEFLINHGADISILPVCDLYGADNDMVKYLVEKNIIVQKIPVLKKNRTGYNILYKK